MSTEQDVRDKIKKIDEKRSRAKLLNRMAEWPWGLPVEGQGGHEERHPPMVRVLVREAIRGDRTDAGGALRTARMANREGSPAECRG